MRRRSGRARQCIRFLISGLRCAAQQAVDHTGRGKTVMLLQPHELRPRQWFVPATPRQPSFPDPAGGPQKLLEAGIVTDDPIVTVMAFQLLRELLVLISNRQVQVLPAPRRQRVQRSLESALRRLAT